MQAEKFYHKCGYPILVVKKQTGLVAETVFVDGNNPFVESKEGKKPKVIQKCPDCGAKILAEKLLTQKPENKDDKRPSGYMPARF